MLLYEQFILQMAPTKMNPPDIIPLCIHRLNNMSSPVGNSLNRGIVPKRNILGSAAQGKAGQHSSCRWVGPGRSISMVIREHVEVSDNPQPVLFSHFFNALVEECVDVNPFGSGNSGDAQVG